MRLRFLRALFLDVLLVPAFLFSLLNADLMTYAIFMGKGQMDILTGARGFDEVYADVSVDEKTKVKLRKIDRIRAYAFDSLGLKRSDNYTTFFDQKGTRLLYVVTAAKPFALEPHLWHFPIVGDVPYKGFFDESKAKVESDRLKAEGWDTDIGGASGWSTLGWFKDPVLSSMLQRSEGDLAELIIHELTHGTIFISGDVDYNENLATFIGVTGAVQYLTTYYGKDSPEYKEYMNGAAVNNIRTEFMLESAGYLDSIYKQVGAQCDLKCKQSVKALAFDSIVQRAKRLNLASDTLYFQRLDKRIRASGNTVFLQYTRYSGKQEDFFSQLQCMNNNLRDFIQKLVESQS